MRRPVFQSARALIVPLLAFVLAAGPAFGPGTAVARAQDAEAAAPTAAIACTEAALAAAVEAGGAITFDCGPNPATIVVNSRKLVDNTVSIDGAGLITISGNNQNGIFEIVSGGSLTIMNLTLTGASNYAAVLNRGSVLVENVTFMDSDRAGVSSSGFSGEVVTAVIRNSRFYRHTRPAVFAGGSTVTIENSSFISNSVPSALGSAIDIEGQNTRVTIAGSVFQHNHSRDGGAIYTGSETDVTIRNSTFFSNTAGAGGGTIYNSGEMLIERTRFEENEGYGGGAIQNRGDLTIEHSYFRDNHVVAYGGGGISHFNQTESPSRLTIRSVTFAGNRGQQAGGAIAFEAPMGTMTLENVTFADNSAQKGGALYFEDGVGTVRHATFVGSDATNTDGDNVQAGDGPDNAGTLAVYNSVFNDGACFGSFTGAGSVQSPGAACGAALTADPQLGPLVDAGAFAPIFMFPSGSPAKNAAAQAHCADFDARGITRPQQGGCDAGAFEFGAAPGLTSVAPNQVGAGTGAFVLIAEGGNFLGGPNGSRVLWNGQALTTTWVSPTRLLAAVPAEMMLAAGTATIQVETPVSGIPDGGISPGTRTVEILYMRYLPVVTQP